MGEVVCVTGAGGFVASWLIKFLLSKGYTVRGTVRQPGDEKNAHLYKLDKASENLTLYKADLLDYDSIHEAISGCNGVFHVASPLPTGPVQNPEVELIEPAVKGTLNVLKASLEAKVKRVIVVSSGAAVTMNPRWPKDRVKDENCWSDKEFQKKMKNWYGLSKTEAESEAMEFGKSTGLDVVRVCPTLVLGPMLQTTANSSSMFLVRQLKEGYESRENKLQKLVDVRDVAEALLLAYEKPEAEWRYICVGHMIMYKDLLDKLKSLYPHYNYPKSYTDGGEEPKMSAEKLQKLGWNCRPLEDTLIDSIEHYKAAGLLDYRSEMALEKERVCVTGAGGYLGSWVVKFLLSKDYFVHGTVREPSDEKNVHLSKLEKASENLKLFKADLLDYDSVLSAIVGCTGVFHVASPVPSTTVPNPEVELIEPAVKGTFNVMKACHEAKVKRVVVVSSLAAVALNPNWPKGQPMDETCWSDKEYCRTTKNWYCLSKTEAESEALDYGKRNGLDVVTVCPSLIFGPLLQSTVNASSLFLLNLLKEGYESMENSHRDIVDVRDVAEAVLLAYEKREAEGRYLCTAYSMGIRELVDKMKSLYPNYNYPKSFTKGWELTTVSSEKLQRLGWSYQSLEETLIDSVESYRKAGILN